MIDYSPCVERLEAMEDRLGIELSALGAATNECDRLYIRGEIASKNGGTLDYPVVIQAAAYNTGGQIISTACVTICNESFCGFDVFEIMMDRDIPDIRKIRVWPKVGN